MKKLILRMGSMLAGLALLVSVVSVNSTCCFYNHQPNLPKEMKKYRRF